MSMEKRGVRLAAPAALETTVHGASLLGTAGHGRPVPLRTCIKTVVEAW